MPVLPFIDLLILAGWSSLFGGFILKFIRMTTTYEASFFGIGPLRARQPPSQSVECPPVECQADG